MKSMTGYGSSRAKISEKTSPMQLEVSVRSVNGRYLDLRTHLPKDFIGLESAIKDLLKKNFLRGTVDLFVQIPTSSSAESTAANIDFEVASHWKNQALELKKKLKLEGSLSLEALIGLPGVIRTSKGITLNPNDEAQLLKSCQEAIKACTEFRLREGKEISQVISNHLDALLKTLKQIEALQEKFEAQLIKKFKTEIKATNDEETKKQLEVKVNEVLEKVNIQEETSRLTQHVRAAKSLLTTKESIGKKLDFFAQEFLREMNTIGSKCQSAEITESVIKGKSAIESFREQVQNIE